MIDLSSDTATRPSAGMRDAMARAEVGDEQKREDPTTRRLEEQVAGLLGKEAALFVPSATMANLCAMLTYLRPGEGFIADSRSHLLLSEGGGYAGVAGAVPVLAATERGVFTGNALRALLPPNDPHYPSVRLVCVENTHNDGGGTVWHPSELKDVTDAARENGLPVHMDGARVLNAATALSMAAHEMTAGCDSVTLCLSKGLGCPAGALLAGTAAFMQAARFAKQRLGGTMRQSGVLAAAGLYALEHNIARLADDHQHAKALAEGLAELPRVQIDLSRVATNMLFFRVDGLSAGEARGRLQEQGARVSGSADRLRAVTHLDVSADDIGRTLDAARRAWA